MDVDMSYDDQSSPHTPVGRPITAAGKRPAPAEWDTHQPHPKRSNPTPHQSQASPGQRDSAKDYSIDVADADTSPSASNELESISSSGMEPSSTRTGRGRGRGRGKGFSRRRKPPGEASTRVWRPKKKSLHTILTKIINYVTFKDSYAFFVKPVNLADVPDYLTVIKEPMDFGTMAQKVQKREYSSCDEFKRDFDLVINNAKTYNPPEHKYHIEAAKLGEIGRRMILRESRNVGSGSEVEEDDEIDIEEPTGRRPSRAAATQAKAAVKAAVKAEATETKKPFKRVKHMDYLETSMSKKYMPDGSLPRGELHETNPWPLLPTSTPWERHINRYSSLFNRSLQRVEAADIPHGFAEYGPYQLRDGNLQKPSSEEAIFYDYVDPKGEAYAKSLSRFASNLGPQVTKHVDGILHTLTRGVYGINKAVESVLSDTPTATTPATVETEFGTVDVAAVVKTLKDEPGRILREAELEVYRREGIDITPLLKPVVYGREPDGEVSREIARGEVGQLIFSNLGDLKAVERVRGMRRKDAGGVEGLTKEEEKVVEGVRRRLLALVQAAPRSEFEGVRLPSMDDVLMLQSQGGVVVSAAPPVVGQTVGMVGRFGGVNGVGVTPVNVQNATALPFTMPPVAQNPYLQGVGTTVQPTVVKPILATDAMKAAVQGRGLGGGGAVL